MAVQLTSKLCLFNEKLTEALCFEALFIAFFSAFVPLFAVMFIPPLLALGPIFGLFFGLIFAVLSFILIAKAVLLAGIFYLAIFVVLSALLPKLIVFVLGCTAASFFGTLIAISTDFGLWPLSIQPDDHLIFGNELVLSSIAGATSFLVSTVVAMARKIKGVVGTPSTNNGVK